MVVMIDWKAMQSEVQTFVESIRPEFEAKLKEWVEIPTVSAEPEHAADMERLADAAVRYVKALGGEAEKVATPGYPVIVGRFMASSDYPTVTIYNHLDVQPANEPQWERPPFIFHQEDGRYFGRGTTDDKGPALSALFGARCALQRKVPVNIQLFWELEEEIGSPNFEHFMKGNAHRLRTDSVVVSDTIWISRGRPAVAYGLRGLVPMRIVLETGTKDVHSGLTGGAARNPLGELCQLIGECYDARTGKVKIPGFYDDVAKPTRREIDSFLASGFNVKRFKEAHELKLLRSTSAEDIVRRIWAQPTFEVHGFIGGYTGPGVKTAIPPRAEAKVSMRLVPAQSPSRIFQLVRDFIKKRSPDAQVLPESFLKPFLGPVDGPYADAARVAMRDAFGKTPAFVREGGSIGAVVTMQKYLKVPVVFLGLSLPEHGYHAPNENFDWEQGAGGMRMFYRYFELLGASR
jgi:acetylornithine deacetylase/succinyl-diaminopimelate desuccinylase-like protein